MSHDLRTPLNGIIGFAEISGQDENVREYKKYNRLIINEAERLLAIIDQLLDVSRIESGKLELVNKPFNLHDLMQAIKFSLGIMAEEKGLDFTIDIADDIPVSLSGDPLRLYQILNNLIGNAVKFTEKGHVTVTVEKVFDKNNQIKLLFKIIDTGIGIPEDKQKQIFESFVQADKDIAQKYRGTGLGTTIARQFVQMMGGEISVQSQINKGSIFQFTALFHVCRKQVQNQKEEPVPADLQLL